MTFKNCQDPQQVGQKQVNQSNLGLPGLKFFLKSRLVWEVVFEALYPTSYHGFERKQGSFVGFTHSNMEWGPLITVQLIDI